MSEAEPIHEVPRPESVINGKIIRFPREVPFMIYEDLNGITHLERDFRILEADRENPVMGHEGRITGTIVEFPTE